LDNSEINYIYSLAEAKTLSYFLTSKNEIILEYNNAMSWIVSGDRQLLHINDFQGQNSQTPKVCRRIQKPGKA
jgi:hypothetical protein